MLPSRGHTAHCRPKDREGTLTPQASLLEQLEGLLGSRSKGSSPYPLLTEGPQFSPL